MADEEVLILKTGVANIASMTAAFERLGASPRLSDRVGDVRDADFVVLPGVGSFGAGMAQLHDLDMPGAIVERIDADRPVLAVCLGLQLLCAASQESPGVDGLGVIDRPVERFASHVRTPQFGWNRVVADPACRFIETGYAYFANSYRLSDVPSGDTYPPWQVGWSDHGGPFVGAAERGRLLACQFHPEISGKWGLGLIQRWLRC